MTLKFWDAIKAEMKIFITKFKGFKKWKCQGKKIFVMYPILTIMF